MTPHPAAGATLRIGELSRRVGVTEHVLRAWESRYGLLQPERTAAGYRLYSDVDERRVRRMSTLLSGGLSAAQAAASVLAEDTPPPAGPPGDPTRHLEALARTLDACDEPAAQEVLDDLFAELSVEGVLQLVLIPYLRELGRRWERGEITVGQEHFASNVVRARLGSLAAGWGRGQGPVAVLACPPGEHHDLALLAFGIVLHREGWRIHYLGADTPAADLATTAATVDPALVVLAATAAPRFTGIGAALRRLAATTPLLLAGDGATPAVGRRIGARTTADDPVTAARVVSRALVGAR